MNISELTNISDYITDCMSKGSIGSYASIGVLALIGICAILGVYFGLMRGFSKSVIRLFTVGASAVCTLFAVKWISKMIVEYSEKVSDGGNKSLIDVLNSYFPKQIESTPDMFKTIFAEVDSKTATYFAMMIIAIALSPVLFIAIFQLLKTITFFIYALLSGLAGAISYGKGIVSTVLGGVMGLLQGLIIAAVIIFPISGLCNVATEAKDSLLNDSETPNEYLEMAYENVIDDLSANPIFDLIAQFGGNDLYKDMITVNINGESVYMGEECIGSVKLIADMIPILNPSFDWKNPTVDERQALEKIVVDIGKDELVAEFSADMMRGVAKAVHESKLNLGLSGATDALVNDVLGMFSTSTKDTIQGDLQVTVDVYFIMCDHNLIYSFTNSEHLDMRELLTNKDASGKTTASAIIDRLNQYDRAQPIVTSFTKISLSVMHGSESFGEESDQLYEKVKGGVSDAISHNRSDYGTEEEYREAVSGDIDAALESNNISVSPAVKEDMVNYIAEKYGDYEGEITDAEVNDALLSYYEAYANNKSESGS